MFNGPYNALPHHNPFCVEVSYIIQNIINKDKIASKAFLCGKISPKFSPQRIHLKPSNVREIY